MSIFLASHMIPTDQLLKVSTKYPDWFGFGDFFNVKIFVNCPMIEHLPYWYSSISTDLCAVL